MPEIYIGPFDTGAGSPPGVTPDWSNPHNCDYRNPAISVVTAQGYAGCVYITLFARNHGNVDVNDAVVTLYGVAGVIDWTSSIPEQLAQLFADASQIAPPWENVVLIARPYPYIEVNPWNTGQVLWHVPQDYAGRYVLFGTVSCGTKFPGPVDGNSNPYDRSRDALFGVWSSVRKPR